MEKDTVKQLSSYENLVVRILSEKKTASAVDIAKLLYPSESDIRPKVSQVSVVLRRLEKKGVVLEMAKDGKRVLFGLAQPIVEQPSEAKQAEEQPIEETPIAPQMPEPLIPEIPSLEPLKPLHEMDVKKKEKTEIVVEHAPGEEPKLKKVTTTETTYEVKLRQRQEQTVSPIEETKLKSERDMQIIELLRSMKEASASEIAQKLFEGADKNKTALIAVYLSRLEKKGLVARTEKIGRKSFYTLAVKPRPDEKPVERMERLGRQLGIEGQVLQKLKELKETSASDLAPAIFPGTEGKTSQIYVTLKRLEQKGLVTILRKEGKKTYFALTTEKPYAPIVLPFTETPAGPRFEFPQFPQFPTIHVPVPHIPRTYAATGISLVIALLIFYNFTGGMGFFTAPNQILSLSLEQQQLGGLQNFIYGVKNINSHSVDNVRIEAVLPFGSELDDAGGAQVEQRGGVTVLTWIVSQINPNEKHMFSFSGKVPGQIRLYATGMSEQEQPLTEVVDKPVQARLPAGEYGYRILDNINPIGYLGEIAITLSAGTENATFTNETVSVPEIPITHVTENITTIEVNETPPPVEQPAPNITPPVEQPAPNVTLPVEQPTPNITPPEQPEENVTLPEPPAEQPPAEQPAENVTQPPGLTPPEENVTPIETPPPLPPVPIEPAGNVTQPGQSSTPPTGGAVTPPEHPNLTPPNITFPEITMPNITLPAPPEPPKPTTHVKIYLDPDTAMNGNEDLIGEQDIYTEWDGTMRVTLPAKKYNESMNLVFYSDRGATVLVKALDLKWVVEVPVNSSETVDILKEIYNNITNFTNATNITENVTQNLTLNMTNMTMNETLNATNATVSVSIIDYTGQYVDADVTLADSSGMPVQEVQQNETTKGRGKQEQTAGVTDLSQKKRKHTFAPTAGKRDIKVSPAGMSIKEINLKNSVSDNVTLGVDYADTARGYVQFYAVKPLTENLTDTQVTVTAKGNELYGCSQWNFASRKCDGNWAFVRDIPKGQDYTLTLNEGGGAYREILITKADHLDANRTFISDIYDQVISQDDVWSEPVYDGEYVRVKFERQLDEYKDITLYARKAQGSGATIEVYYFNSSEKITEFPLITGAGYYKVLLTGMRGTGDTFDLRVKGANNASLEFDHIIDPSAPREETTAEYFIYQNMTQTPANWVQKGIFQVSVPETNPKVKSAYIEIKNVIYAANMNSASRITLQNQTTNTTLTVMNVGPANSGEQQLYVIRVDALPVMSQITKNGTYNFTLYANMSPIRQGESAKLVLTYDHDYSAREVKTVKFFIGQRTNPLILNQNTSFNFSGLGLPETNPTVRSAFFEIYGHEAPASTTDDALSVCLDNSTVYCISGTTIDNAGQTSTDFFLLYNYSTLDVTAPHTLNFKYTAGYSLDIVGAELVLTYEYDSSSPTQLKTVKYLVGQDEAIVRNNVTWTNSTLVRIPEDSKSIASVYNKVRFGYSFLSGYGTLVNRSELMVNSSISGNPAAAQFIYNYSMTDEMVSPATVLYNATDLYTLNDGQTVLCSVFNGHTNISYYTSSKGCELTITYNYSTSSPHWVKTVDYYAGDNFRFLTANDMQKTITLAVPEDNVSFKDAYLDSVLMGSRTTAGNESLRSGINATNAVRLQCNYNNTGEDMTPFCWDDVGDNVTGPGDYRVFLQSVDSGWYDSHMLLTYGFTGASGSYVGWNATGITISTSPGTSRSTNVTVIATGSVTNTAVTEIEGNGTSFISEVPVTIGSMSNAQQQQVQITCAPSASQATGYYEAILNVNSTESVNGDNITVGCRVTTTNVTIALPANNTAYNRTGFLLNISVFVTNNNQLPVDVWYSVNGEPNVSIKDSKVNTDWNQFRHDELHSGFSDSYPTLTNQTFFKVPGAVGTFDDFMSPIVVNDTLYIGSKTNAGWARAYNATTGEIKWEFWPYQECWDGAFFYEYSNRSIYLGCRAPVGFTHNYFYKLDADNGRMIWNWTNSNAGLLRISGSPIVNNGAVYFCTRDVTPGIYAVNATNGTTMWNATLDADCTNSVALAPDPVTNDTMVYAAVNGATNTVFAYFAANGTKKWSSSQAATWDSSPVVVGDYLYQTATTGVLRAFNRANGTLMWSNSTPAGNTYSTVNYHAGQVFNKRGPWLFAFNVTNGTNAYPAKANWELNITGTDAYGTCGLGGGMIYCPASTGSGGNKTIYGINESTGVIIWKYQMQADSFSGAIIVDGITYIAADDTYLYAIGDEKHYGYKTNIPMNEGANNITIYANNSDGVTTYATSYFNFSVPADFLWNQTTDDIRYVNQGSSLTSNVTLNSTDSNSNVNIYSSGNGADIITVSPSSLGSMAENQSNQIMFNCSPPTTKIAGQYVAIFGVNSTEHPAFDNITVYCYVVETVPPQWSGNSSSIPSNYSPTNLTKFNITWNDNSALSTAIYIEGNWSGTPRNYTMFRYNASAFGYNETLPAGTFYWESWANDTVVYPSPNWNTSNTIIFSIGKSATTTRLFLNRTEANFSYTLNSPANFTALVNISGQNATIKSNMTGWVLQSNATGVINITSMTRPGIFNMTGYIPENANYTASSATWYATMIAVPQWSENSTSIPYNYSTTNSSKFNITWNGANGGISTVLLENNMTGTPTNYTMFMLADNRYSFNDTAPAGVFYWKTFANDTQGNMSASINWTFKVYNATNVIDIYFNNGTQYANQNMTVIYGTQTNVTANASSEPAVLYRNNTATNLLVANPDIESLGAGNWTFKANSTGNANYTTNFTGVNYTVWVMKAPMPTTLYLNGTSGNRTYGLYTPVNFTVTVGLSGETVYLNSTFTGWVTQSGVTPLMNYTNLTKPGAYNVTGYYSTTANYSNSTKTYFFNVSQLIWSNNRTSIPNNYSTTNSTKFNVTWTDSWDNVNASFIEGNWSGTATNYTMSNFASTGNYSYNDTLPAGYFCYKYYANDSANSWNTTSTWCFRIYNSTNVIDLYFRNSSGEYKNQNMTVMYGTQTNATAVFGGAQVLYRNNVLDTNPDIDVLGVGTWTYKANSTGNQNYTSNLTGLNYSIRVLQSPTAIRLFLNGTEGNASYNANQIANFTVDVNASGQTVYLTSNMTGWVVQSGVTPLYNYTVLGTAGMYNMTCWFPGNENYTASSMTYYANVSISVDTAPPQWSGNSTNIQSTYSTTVSKFNITWTDAGGVSNVTIEGNWSGAARNYTMFIPNTNSVFSYNETLPAGTFYWKSFANDTTGNQNVSDTWYFTVGKATTTTKLFLNGTEGNAVYYAGQMANFTATVDASGETAYLDSNITGWVPQSGATPLFNYTVLSTAGKYNLTAYYTGGDNYTASSQTYYVTVATSGIQWNQTSLQLTADQGSYSGFNVTVLSNGTNSNAAVYELSSNATDYNYTPYHFIYAIPSSLGTLTDGQQQQVRFNCSPTDVQDAGYYEAKFNVNSTGNTTGGNITVGCTVSLASPSVTIRSPTNVTDYSHTITIDVTVGNVKPSVVTYSLNGGPNTTMTWIDTNFSTYGGNSFHTGVSTSKMPDTPQFLWMANVTGTFDEFMQPVAKNEILYITGKDYDGNAGAYKGTRTTFFLNATTGKQICNITKGGTDDAMTIGNNGIVYMAGYDPQYNFTYAFNATNCQMIWNFSMGNLGYTGGSVVLDESRDVVFVNGNEVPYVYALGARNGSSIWNYTDSAYYFAFMPTTMTAYDGKLYIAGFTRGESGASLIILNETDGTALYGDQTEPSGHWDSSPTIDAENGVFYIGGQDGDIYAHNLTDLRVVWKFDTGTRDAAVLSTPAFHNGTVFAGGQDHNFYALDAKTGVKKWSYPTGGDIYSSPTVADGMVAFGSNDGYTYVVNEQTGALVWSYNHGAALYGSPMLYNGILYVPADNWMMYAFGNVSTVYRATITPADGTNTLTVYANNSDGDTASSTVTFTSNTTLPALSTAAVSTATVAQGGTVRINLTATHPAGNGEVDAVKATVKHPDNSETNVTMTPYMNNYNELSLDKETGTTSFSGYTGGEFGCLQNRLDLYTSGAYLSSAASFAIESEERTWSQTYVGSRNVSQMCVYSVYSATGANNMVLGIYDDNSDYPNKLLCWSKPIALADGTGWQCGDVNTSSTNCVLNESTQYHLIPTIQNTNGGYAIIANAKGDAMSRYASWGTNPYPTLPGTVSLGSVTSSKWGCFLAEFANSQTTDRYTNSTSYNYMTASSYDNVTTIEVTVQVSSYNPSASAATGTAKPDLQLGVADGSGYEQSFVPAGNFSLNSSYLGNTSNSTAANFTINVTDGQILSAWKNSKNRNVRLRGVDLDWYNSSAADSISVTGVWVKVYYQNRTGVYYYDFADTAASGTYNVTAGYADDTHYGNANSQAFTGVGFVSSDETPPLWSSNSTNIPATYSTAKSVFNVTWIDADTSVSAATFESNFSGVATNYTMFTYNGSVFSYNNTLPAGTYYWKSFANDTGNNQNVSDTWYFTVGKATTTTKLFLNGTEANKGYYTNDPANFTATVSAAGKTVYMASNLTGWTLQSGTTPLFNYTIMSQNGKFNLTAWFAGDANYSASSATYYATVSSEPDTKGPYWFDNKSSVPASYSAAPSVFNMTWTDDTGVLAATLESNFTGTARNYTMFQFNETTYSYNETLPAGTFYWKSYANDTVTPANWNVTNTWTFTIGKAANTVDLYLNNGTQYKNINVSVLSGAQTNATADSAGGTAKLYRDGAYTGGSTEVTVLDTGTYAYKANATGNANYSANLTGTTYYVTVIRALTASEDLNASTVAPSDGVKVSGHVQFGNGTAAAGATMSIDLNGTVLAGLTQNASGNLESGTATEGIKQTMFDNVEPNSDTHIDNFGFSAARYGSGCINMNWHKTTAKQASLSGHSPTTVWFSGYDSGDYDSLCVAALTSKKFDMSKATAINLSFAGYVNVEPPDTTMWDGAYVDFSNDNGTTWSFNYQPVQNYDASCYVSYVDQAFPVTPPAGWPNWFTYRKGYCGSIYTPWQNGDSQKFAVNSSYLDNNFTFRFVQYGDWATMTADGFYVDDVNLTYLVDNESATLYKEYNNVSTASSSNLTQITVTVQVNGYDPTGSVASGNAKPDLEVALWNGTDYTANALLHLDGFYTSNSSSSTVANFTAVFTTQQILDLWAANASERDLAIRGVNFDQEGGANDSISWTGVYVTLTSPGSVITDANGDYSLSFAAPSIAGNYPVNVNVSYGGYNATNSTLLTVTSPAANVLQYTLNASNTTAPDAFTAVLLYANWTNSTVLGYATLETNETGSWKNQSTVSLAGSSWSNFSWTNNSLDGYTVVAWRIYANDTAGDQNATDVNTFQIGSLVSITLTQDTIDLGYLETGDTNSTSSGTPAPFTVRNGGNVRVNLTINGTDMWAAQANPSANYRYAANNSSEGVTYNGVCSDTAWTNMPAYNAPRLFLCFLEWLDTKDEANVEIAVTVPTEEPAGAKSSTVTIIASQA